MILVAHIFSPAQAREAAFWDFLSPNKEEKINCCSFFLTQTISPRVSPPVLLSHFLLPGKLCHIYSGPAAGSTGRIQTLN